MNKKTQDFFNANPKIRDLAFEARDELKTIKYFPGSSIYFTHDFDVDIKKEIIWIVISCKISYEEAYQRLDEFDEWWMPKLTKIGGKIAITIKAKEYI